MNTPSRAALRTAPATVFGMSWNLRSRNTRWPRFWASSTAAGPALVKSWEPIFTPLTASSNWSSSRPASSSESTSSATKSRSRIGVVLLQASHVLLALEERLDGADGGLSAVDGEVVGDVLADGRAPDGRRVLAG